MPGLSLDHKPKCLVISYWPPWEEVPGGIRMRRLLGGLHAQGWDVSLVTSGSIKPKRSYHDIDSCLVLPRLFQVFGHGPANNSPKISKGDPEPDGIYNLRRIRDGVAFSFRNLPIPRRAGWLAWYPKILNWAKSQRFDILYSKSQPNSSHVLGRLLSRYLGIPWVAELGDLWSQNPYYQRPKSGSRAESTVERWVLSPAKGLVTVSHPMAEQLESLHNKPTRVVYNCFPENLGETPFIEESYELTLPLRILHAGRVYPQYRMPDILLEAVKRLLTTNSINESELRLDFLCSNHGWLSRWMQQYYPSLADVCSVMPPVPLEEALIRQRQSHVLLTIGWSGQGHEGVVTSKFFEYMGAGRKMLCTVKAGGALERIGRQIPGVELVHDVRETEAAVMKLVDLARRGSRVTFSREYREKVRPYSCNEQAGRLSDFLMGFV
jgi:hypothetical protein